MINTKLSSVGYNYGQTGTDLTTSFSYRSNGASLCMRKHDN